MTDELITVSELADTLRVRPSTIRHWMQVGLLRPASVAENGYRMFDRMSLVRAKEIKRLRDERYTIEEIRGRLG
jgi:DNA-binding transcriptional MerR regulator